jgi:hypothetical protein
MCPAENADNRRKEISEDQRNQREIFFCKGECVPQKTQINAEKKSAKISGISGRFFFRRKIFSSAQLCKKNAGSLLDYPAQSNNQFLLIYFRRSILRDAVNEFEANR